MFRFAYGRDGFSFFTGEQNRGRSRKGVGSHNHTWTVDPGGGWQMVVPAQ